MTAQMLPNLVYAALLLAVLLAPYLSAAGSSAGKNDGLATRLVTGAILTTAILLTIARQGGFMPLSLILLIPLIGLGPRVLLGGMAAVLLFAPVTWWRPGVPMTPLSLGLFVALGLAAAGLPRLRASVAGGEERPVAILLPALACLVIGLAVGLLTAPFGSIEPIYLAWHHWGAYLAPVDAWLSGGLPYRDFPVQYGLGPTVLLASVCGTDCWRGIYGVAIGANALYFATLAGCALLLTARSSRGLRWLALTALFCAAFGWTGYPSNFAGPVTTPSVAGLRFLPVSALLLHILLAERRGDKGRGRRDWIGHLIWLADLFWSPEAAMFGTLVWWPYLALRDAAGAANRRDALLLLARGALCAVIALAVGLAGLAVIVWLLSGRALALGDFLVYIRHPPGPLPANPVGTLWLALASVALGWRALVGQGPSSRARSLYACLLGFMAAGTYYLSRSHDNNILNLFPLLILLLLASLAALERAGTSASAPDGMSAFAGGFVRTMLAAMVAFVALFNLTPWTEAAARGGLFELGPTRLIARFTPRREDMPQPLAPDAVAGLEYLRSHHGGMVVLLSKSKVMPWSPPGSGWTSMNNLANFAPLPRDLTLHYIRRGAAAYRRPGWILVDDALFGDWVPMFETAYDVRARRRFGAYTAYYLVPR